MSASVAKKAVTITDADGDSPLSLAARAGRSEIVQILVPVLHNIEVADFHVISPFERGGHPAAARMAMNDYVGTIYSDHQALSTTMVLVTACLPSEWLLSPWKEAV